ncbi:MAG: hypothetical protein KatS3mg042_0836 [Rhodothermaceae bacterium]|nr:MAG: hypothetical protein KatS3mg042_0836 [Rhodothermaceae bacterium]
MAETIRTPVFTRYEVIEKIGSGSMGAVYKARDVRLDRYVALKVLPPGLRDHPELLERFKREARVLARMKHPGVASVYDADVESDFPFMVMELVEGENLEQILQARGPLPVDEVIRLGIEVAEGLEHIHCHRIVHRDIKTANIVLGPEGRAVITDFGIAFVASLPRLSHGMLGTPEYMSPEQADGRPMDGRADLYSVGVVLYECLTGRVPFERTGESLTALTDLLRRILTETPPPLRTLRPDVPVWLAEVVERCLAKDPNDRFARAAELAAALQPPPVIEAPTGQAASPLPAAWQPESTAGPTPSTILISHAESVEAVRFSPDGRRLATACKDRAIRIWEVKRGRLVHLLKGPSALSVSFRPGGVYLAAGCVDGVIRVWEVERERVVHAIQAHTGYVLSVAYSPSGDLLASGAMDGAVHLWNARTGRLVRTLGQHTGYVLSVSFSPDGTKLASGSADGAVRLWDAASGRLLRRLEGHAGYVPAVAFSPDGTRLASGGVDGAVRLWDVASGRLLHKLQGHSDWVMSVAFSPDGARLASAGRDQSVRLWDARRGRPLDRLKGHTGAVMSVAFSPDGARLASGSTDHTVRLWRLGRPPFRFRRWFQGLVALSVLTSLGWLGHTNGLLPLDRLPLDRLSLDRFDLSGLLTSPERPADEPAPPSPEAEHRPPETRPPRRSSPPPRITAPPSTSRDPESTSSPEALPPDVPAETPALRPASPHDALYGDGGILLSRGGYTLVVAMEPSRERAQRLAARYRDEGFRVAVLGVLFQGRLSYRVVLGQFASRTEAGQARDRLVRADHVPFSTWIMRVRPDRIAPPQRSTEAGL